MIRRILFYKNHLFLIGFLLICLTSFSQITFTENTWIPIGNTELRTRFDDADNGDGLNDGAIGVNGIDTIGPLGVLYTFQGNMINGEAYTIQTSVYNYVSSYIKYRVELYNMTDNVILTTSPLITIVGSVTTPENTTISYIATNTDDGDILQLRYVRENTEASNHIARDFAIDNVRLNGILFEFDHLFFTKPTIDIPAVAPTNIELTEMDLILSKMSDNILGTTNPINTNIIDAVSKYNALNIVVNNNTINGNMPTPEWEITVWESGNFLKTFAQHLKYNPIDTTIYSNGLTMQEMASNTIWFFCDAFYRRQIPRDYITYFYKLFAAPTIFLKPYLSSHIKELFYFSLIEHSSQYIFFWEEEYITGQPGTQGAINIDDIGNMSGIQLAFGLMQDTPEERLQWAKGFKRYYERFMSHTPGTSDGIKSDGSSFHHRSGLNNYTYNYNTPMFVLSVLDGTSFQVSQEAYKVFRKGIYTQLLVANEDVEPLSMAGRHPEARRISPNKNLIRLTAITGGHILGLSNPDPIIANAYVRQWGNHNDLPNAIPEVLSGFKPLNYHGMGVYWKNNWMASSRGESNWSFGSEMIRDHQHYGRYQSYGTLEIIYEGGEEIGNGFRFNGWNWNYNPGTTAIVLPWELLRVENKYQKEYQKKGFVGTLSLEHQNNEVYKSMGETGMFAMEFAESDTNHGYTPFGPNTHDSSFLFKKSVFFFEDYIVALGSEINNEDTTHPTVTTLFQRMSENQANVNVNGTIYANFETNTFNGSNWIIDNFNTGYYVVGEGSNQLKIQRENQHIPFLDDFDYTLSDLRAPVDYSIGYINHGTNPVNAGYEFVVKPDVTASNMSNFAVNMSNDTTKPYQVYQKTETAHIVKDKNNGTVGYALFTANANLSNALVLKANDIPCLAMYKEINAQTILLSVSNPDMGFFVDSFEASVEVPIQITLHDVWTLENTHPEVSIINTTDTTTTIQFNTFDGKPIEIQLNKFNVEININEGICTEAESGTITAMQTAPFYIETITQNQGTATYTFTTDTAGTYKIKATVFAVDSSSDSFYYQIDNETEEVWDFNPTGESVRYNHWMVDEVTKRGAGTFDNPEQDPYLINLTQGIHTITFRGREVAAKIDEFCFVKQETLSNENYLQLREIVVYPNPGTGLFNFKYTSDYTGIINIQVISMDGRKVKNIKLEKESRLFNQQINLSSIEKGMYIVQINEENYQTYKQIIKN